jgi:O-methyltransferase
MVQAEYLEVVDALAELDALGGSWMAGFAAYARRGGRRLARLIGLRGGATDRLEPPLLQRAMRLALERFSERTDLYVVRVMSDPYRRLDYHFYALGTPWSVQSNLIRFGTTELLCRAIKERGVVGAIAEVGVYQGTWARVANHHLPDRQIYLFDTFEGFDERDLDMERRSGLIDDVPYAVGHWPPARVVEALTHPEQARIRPGWFPETAAGLEEQRFCLVDVDVGLAEPTRAALEWFYPRMMPGGYLIVADYNNRHTPGVKSAVDGWVAETRVGFVPLIDHEAAIVIPT